MRLLVVGDQLGLRNLIARHIRVQGDAADIVGDTGSADSFLKSYVYDAIVLGAWVSSADGLKLLRRWRLTGMRTPVLFLTGRDEAADRIEGFASGADDCLSKPFAMDELFARLGAIARRGLSPRPGIIRIQDLQIDLARREVRRGKQVLAMRPKEFAVLRMLAERAGQLVYRKELIMGCWDESNEPASNAEEVIIASLRRKLGVPNLLRTIRGAGYLLESSDAAG